MNQHVGMIGLIWRTSRIGLFSDSLQPHPLQTTAPPSAHQRLAN